MLLLWSWTPPSHALFMVGPVCAHVSATSWPCAPLARERKPATSTRGSAFRNPPRGERLSGAPSTPFRLLWRSRGDPLWAQGADTSFPVGFSFPATTQRCPHCAQIFSLQVQRDGPVWPEGAFVAAEKPGGRGLNEPTRGPRRSRPSRCLPSGGSKLPPAALRQPIRIESWQPALANPRPAFAGNAKPLGKKQ